MTDFERDAIASFKAGGPGFFSRLDRVGPRCVWCEAIALNNGAFLEGTDADPRPPGAPFPLTVRSNATGGS